MSDHNTLSKSEEMYLVTIRQICEHCDDKPIPIPDIAAALEVQPVSVNQMIKKLAEAGFVNYIPYKGAELTLAGHGISTRVLRHRRLWEVFLVKALKMEIEDADELACQLEHTTSVDVANRLSEFLNHPTICYHGNPIYPPGDQLVSYPEILLSSVKVGQPFHIIRIEEDGTMGEFLSAQGVYPGNQGCILAANGAGTILVETSPSHRITITKEIADLIYVEEQHD